MPLPLLLPQDVLKRGLWLVSYSPEEQKEMSNEDLKEEFHAHYGSSPLVIADMWYDLTTTSIEEAALVGSENSEQGFKRFLIAQHFLWTYPKNVRLIKSRFKICLRHLEGEELWLWPKKIAALKAKKVVWDRDLQSHETARIPLSVDGVNYRTWKKNTIG